MPPKVAGMSSLSVETRIGGHNNRVGRFASPLMLAVFALLASAELCSCAEKGLQRNESGWVSFSRANPVGDGPAETLVRFRRQNGCIIIETPSGDRLLPILPRGQQFAVEPEGGLYQGRWKVWGLDTDSDRVVALRNDPVAKACGARPAFIHDVAYGEPPPPIPEAVR
jgi:hypothetical protein